MNRELSEKTPSPRLKAKTTNNFRKPQKTELSKTQNIETKQPEVNKNINLEESVRLDEVADPDPDAKFYDFINNASSSSKGKDHNNFNKLSYIGYKSVKRIHPYKKYKPLQKQKFEEELDFSGFSGIPLKCTKSGENSPP